MAQEPNITIELFASGYCTAHEKFVNAESGRGKCRFYAVWALINCAHNGYILFDTGYSHAFMHATKALPERAYRWATPVFINQKETAKEILLQKGIRPGDIQYIILSHFHADHIAGLLDFPDSRIICSKVAHDEVIKVSGLRAVSKGILHRLLPAGYEKRLMFIEDIASAVTVNENGLTEFSLLNIEGFKLIQIPGHARAMLGFILKKKNTHILYASDASWSYSTYEQQILPRKIVKLFFDSWSDFIDTQKKIRAYEKMHSGVKVLFTHCPETLKFLNHAF